MERLPESWKTPRPSLLFPPSHLLPPTSPLSSPPSYLSSYPHDSSWSRPTLPPSHLLPHDSSWSRPTFPPPTSYPHDSSWSRSMRNFCHMGLSSRSRPRPYSSVRLNCRHGDGGAIVTSMGAPAPLWDMFSGRPRTFQCAWCGFRPLCD